MKMSASATRGRPKTYEESERRQNIVQSAYRAFVELGFANTSTAEVARRAKVSKRTLYEVFNDKQALFAAVISEHRHLLLDLPRPAEEQCALDECLFRIFRLDIDEEASLEREAILRLMTRESILFPELSDYLYETRAVSSREMLIAWLRETAIKRGFPLDNVEVYAGMLMDIVFGALLPRRHVVDTAEKKTITAHVKIRIQVALKGMEWK